MDVFFFILGVQVVMGIWSICINYYNSYFFVFRLFDLGNVLIYKDVFKLYNRILIVGQLGKFLDFEKFFVFLVFVIFIDLGLFFLFYVGVIRIVLQDVNDQLGNIFFLNSQVCVYS